MEARTTEARTTEARTTLQHGNPATSTPSAAEKWISFRKATPAARIRLFCFPFAGGGASVYRTWQAGLPPEIEVCPVQLPGRENRLSEDRFRRMDQLAAALAGVLEPWLDRPFAFFGHSMGAVIAYETAQLLRSGIGKVPSHLFVSARRAPGEAKPERMWDLPEDEFRTKLLELEGTPPAVLEHPELMELVGPLLRADFELNDTWEPSDLPPLEIPVTALGGLTDKEVDRPHLEAWKKITRGRFQLRMLPGGHFFLQEQQPALLEVVARELLPVTGG